MWWVKLRFQDIRLNGKIGTAYSTTMRISRLEKVFNHHWGRTITEAEAIAVRDGELAARASTVQSALCPTSWISRHPSQFLFCIRIDPRTIC